MMTLSLNGCWKLKRTDESEWLEAKVPGSVYNDLLSSGKMQDPFFRDNEDDVTGLSYYDYEYERDFYTDAELLASDRIILECKGLDTLAEIAINGYPVANTCNMHRTYEFEVKELLKEGKNNIHITFRSPLKFIEKKQAENPLWGVKEAVPGYPHIRKAHYMYGWDWGPHLPDMGIWRTISLKGYSTARLEDVYITQKHEHQRVSLDVRIRNQNWANKAVILEACVTSPDGSTTKANLLTKEYENNLTLNIDRPQLWWPNGFGKQPLYKAEVTVKDGERILDYDSFNIGLRTFTVRREKDPWGETFEYAINGHSIFAMGADYIPEDNILSRCNPVMTEKLIKDCAEANFNSIRIWGGGIYPEDYFFDLCDKYGLIVWHDLMFACAVYDMTEGFTDEIIHEVKDNMKRTRHHASLGLWCGNNEMEWAWDSWDLPKIPKLRVDYIKQFEFILPQVARDCDPNTFYWRASPSSGGNFDDPNNSNKGDVHYWDVWHGQKPFTDFRKYYFRFASEFGLQSFPCLKTVESYTMPEDRNIFTHVMEKHQRNGSGNAKILYYISEHFKYPKDFDSLLYTSQLIQAEGMRYGVEHMRRNRGRCMGSIYWQLNDCWPVASWSSIDSFGRWKALHYFARKFYAPVLLSAQEEGKKVSLHVTNETLDAVKGEISWKLRNNKSTVLKEGTVNVDIGPLSASMCEDLDFTEILVNKHDDKKVYLEYSLMVKGSAVSSGTVLLTRAKYFEFLDPGISLQVTELEDRFVILVRSDNYAKFVELGVRGMDCVFSDNYFDISAGMTKEIEIKKDRSEITAEELSSRLTVRSIYDIA